MSSTDTAPRGGPMPTTPTTARTERTSSKKYAFDTCSCQAPVLSVMDDIGLHDEFATVVIVGGGPHALAALSALHENSLAFPQFANDAAFANRVGFDSYKKIGSGPKAHPAPARP